MKTKINLGLLSLLVLIAIVTSCSTSSDVATNRLIQKRKYRKGFHIEKNTRHFGKIKKVEDDQIAKENNTEIQTIENWKTSNSNTEVLSHSQPESTETIINSETPAEISVNDQPYKATSVSTIEEISKPTKRMNIREIPKQKRAQIKAIKKAVDSDVMLVILVILAIVLPPLAVFLYEGVTNRFWIDLIVALIGWGLAGWLFGGTLAAIGGLFAIVYALLIVLEVI